MGCFQWSRSREGPCKFMVSILEREFLYLTTRAIVPETTQNKAALLDTVFILKFCILFSSFNPGSSEKKVVLMMMMMMGRFVYLIVINVL